MDFELSEEQRMIVNSAKEIAKAFGPEYWRGKEEREEFAVKTDLTQVDQKLGLKQGNRVITLHSLR